MKKHIAAIASFSAFHIALFKEILKIDITSTLLWSALSILLPLASIVELKFSEYIINEVAYLNFSESTLFFSIIKTVAAIMIIMLIFQILEWIFGKINNRLTKKIITYKKSELFKKTAKISYENFENSDFFNKLWIAKKAPSQYAVAIGHIFALINIIIYFFSYGIMLCQIHVLFLVFLITAFLLYLGINKKYTGKWDDYYENYITPEQRKCNYFERVLSSRINHSTIQTNRLLSYFTKKYEKHADEERKYTLKMNLLSFAIQFAMSLILFVFIFIIMIYTAEGIATEKYSIGKFTFTSELLFRLFSLFRSLTQYIFTEKHYIYDIKTYQSIFDLPEEIDDEIENLAGQLSIENLTYKYAQATNNSLEQISCKFQLGQKIAIVGANGSGKTTLMLILLNLLQRYSGKFKNTIGNPVGIMQDFQFYQMTIKENIELGRSGKLIDENEINNILEKVQLNDFVKELPHGCNTYLGQIENGIEFSKGQFQRLALARMLANDNAKIWILDEPTAYLDPIAEIKMYDHVLSLSENRLVFFISHRLGFAKKADKIIVLDNGKIAEIGTHEELMESNSGIYKTMYNSQLEWYFEN